MPLPLRKRTIFFYELRLESTTRAAGIANPGNCGISAMLSAFSAQASPRRLPLKVGKSSSTVTYLMDWAHNAQNGSYEILVNKANAKLSDVALRDLNTAVLRRANKTRVEGIENSAHVIVRPNRNNQTALILLTMGCGILAGDLERIFRMMAKHAARDPANRNLYYFDDPSGARGPDNGTVKYKVQYQFPMMSYMGQTLDDALRTGRFSSMELIAMDRQRFDAGGNLQVEERSLKISSEIPEAVTGATIRNGLRFFQTQPDAALYDKLRLNFRTRSGRPTTATLGLNDLDAAFTRREVVEFAADVESQHNILSPTIMEAMRPLLADVP